MSETEAPKRVLIADDDDDTRTLLTDILGQEPSVEVVGAAKDADEVIALADVVKPDVAILDWLMPGGGGRAAREIKDRHPSVAIIALTGLDSTEASYDMMSSGAVAFLQKGCPRKQLIDAIRSATRWD